MTICVVGKTMTSGHGSYLPRPTIVGESLHTVNGVAVVCVGDTLGTHIPTSSNQSPHGSVTNTGQSRHTINGRAVCNAGSVASCGETLIGGDPLHTL
ncbi:hypothetical protein [Endozoicomonas lisbonensis]|uniref:Zn-binding protein involved in type VI secretion n=1 Tax=Endozoicomonas lisbonensis TaxID=3120522 RepID=A0ABV2SPA1_9GAMM